MRILHLSAYDLFGGAGKAAFRLHCALVDAGEDSLMLVRQKDSDRADVHGPDGWLWRFGTKAQRRAERLLVLPRATAEFSVGSLPDGMAGRVRALRPDVIHVHWVSHGFLRLETLAELGIPVVWTMHDMWAFTGGCHYSGACERYREGCGHCPVLESRGANDASHRGMLRRAELAKASRLTLIAPSEWIAGCARRSAAMAAAEVRVISYTVDVTVFSPRDRREARRRWGLPDEGRILLAGAMGTAARKGGEDFKTALRALGGLKTGGRRINVAIFGTPERRQYSEHGLTVHELGFLSDQTKLADLYAAADVFVAPSRQDNLPNTVMEAMACGTPVIGSRVGGIPDMVDHGVNGLLVEPGDADGIAQSMARLLGDENLRVQMGRAARDKVMRCYAPGVIVAAHRALYAQVGLRA